MDKSDAAIAGLTIFALVIGAALTIVLDIARGQLVRKQRKQDRRDDFQHQTLLALQDAVYAHARNLAEIIHFERMEHIRAGGWRSQRLPDKLNNTDYEGRLQISMLSVRIQDDMVRRLIGEYTEAEGSAVTAFSLEDAEEANNRANNVRKQANDQIGELLRGL